MIARAHPNLSIVRQCEILELSRSAFYYTPVGIDEETLVIMKAIDQAFTKYPFFGSCQLRTYLRRDGLSWDITGFDG
jgi:putative transposase